VAHDPGALRVDHSDRVGRNRRLIPRRCSATLCGRGSFGSGDYRRLERRIVVEDGSLEALELIVRLEPEFLVQQPPPRPVDLERIRLAGERLTAEVTVEDPLTLSKPWVSHIGWVRDTGFDRMVQVDWSNDRTGRGEDGINTIEPPADEKGN
jgi:hypothetical protein